MLLAVENLLQKTTIKKNLLQTTTVVSSSVSAHNSPVSNKRHKLNISTASLASCSSQVNNNYTNLDMESLEDMLIKVC